MKQKINLRLIIISILAVFVTLTCVTFVYYGLFKQQIKNDLRTQARIISSIGLNEIKESNNIKDDEELRITWIADTGEVLYDNDVKNLDNHLDRPEVIAALKNKEGESVRESDTLNMRTFYYAILLKDGTILRVSIEARSIFSVFLSSFKVLLPLTLLIVAVCILLSHLLTKNLLEPINKMAEDIDNMTDVPYKELEPFVVRIREQHNAILKAAKIRQDFTANVSHELKTPITAISGYAELIENGMAIDNEKKFAKEIRKQSNRLISLVNDVINLSKLDHLESIPEFSQIDVYDVAKERVELLKNNAREKNITLNLYGQHFLLTSNRDLLIELFDNLIQNAIRYNVANGFVDVEVNNDEAHVLIEVKDSGIGIPKDEIDRVFERFYRVDKSRTRETGGTGLGLAIVKHIVELHDGEISLESKEGIGTTVRVKL